MHVRCMEPNNMHMAHQDCVSDYLNVLTIYVLYCLENIVLP